MITANISWKNANKGNGIEVARLQGSPLITPLNIKKVRGSPIKPPSEKLSPGAWLSIPSTSWLKRRLPLPTKPLVLGVLKVSEELNGLGIITEAIRIDEFTGKKFTFFTDPDGLPLEIYQR